MPGPDEAPRFSGATDMADQAASDIMSPGRVAILPADPPEAVEVKSCGQEVRRPMVIDSDDRPVGIIA